MLHPEKQADQKFKAKFIGIDGEPARVANGKDKDGKEQFIASALPDKKAMDEVLAALEKANWSVTGVQAREQQRRPLAPFITSQLQRDAANKLGFNVRRTMGVAQRLYEGVDLGAEGTTGLITYMRTDSPRVAPEAMTGAREWIAKQLGQAVSARDAERVQGQEGRAGRARGDPADGCGADAGVDCALSERRAVEALHADLAAICGFADGSRGLRRDDGEYCRSFSEDAARPTISA